MEELDESNISAAAGIQNKDDLCHTRKYIKLKFYSRNIVNLFIEEEVIEVDQLKETNNNERMI